MLDALLTTDWPPRPPARMPPGASALELATQAPALPTRLERMGWGCMQAAFSGRLDFTAGELVTDAGPDLWPRGFSARLVDDRAELVAPDGTVVAREGEMVVAGGGWLEDIFFPCSIDGTDYGPAS